MIIKANIKTNPTINVNLEQGMGQGAMSPEDKAMLETLANRPSLTQYFDDAKSNILYWNGETIGLENYENFYKVSDVTPKYGNLQDYSIYVTYREIKSHYLMTSELSIIGDNSAGYCALGTVSSGPAGTQIYAYVMYENNSLGVSAGTYLSKYYEVSALDVGHHVYEKKVIKEDCLPDKVVESTNQVQNVFKFSGGDTLNWDGKTQDLEVADANFYRVSAAIPTFEELSRVYRASSFIKSVYDWNRYTNLVVNDYRNTEGYCSIDTSGLADDHTLCRVYYKGNAAKVTSGTYFYADETIYVDELVLGDYGKFTPVLKEECLPLATESMQGAMSSAQHTKLENIQEGAEKNVVTGVGNVNAGGAGTIGYTIANADGITFKVPRLDYVSSGPTPVLYHGILPKAAVGVSGIVALAERITSSAEGVTTGKVVYDYLEGQGYAKQTSVDELSEEIADLNTALESGELDGLSAYQLALNKGFEGTEEQWIASLHASNPTILSKAQYPTEVEAIAYMEEQGDTEAVYVWNNKLYCNMTRTVTQNSGVAVFNYRNSGSSGITASENRTLLIFDVSSFTAPLTIDISPFAIGASPYIYGGTSPTALSTPVYSNDNYVGRTAPFELTDLKGCTYLAFTIATSYTEQPTNVSIKVNDTVIPFNVIAPVSTSAQSAVHTQILSNIGNTTTTVSGFADSGVIYTAIVGKDSGQQYLSDRKTYVMPVPDGYCESKVEYNTNGTHYLNKYNFATMTGLFTALATTNPEYVTEKTLGKDATGTYDIKSYVLDAPTTISSGYDSAMKNKKPTFIITSGLHGVEPDAVHMVYHFMKDLCENYMESEHLEYLRNHVRFVIVPISNPWGYVNQTYNNSNDVDLNKNFGHGYRTNGTANTGTGAYSEAETLLLKGVFDTYKDAVFHLECHGKYGEDTSFAQTIWFSLMRSLNSELIELCADTITKQIGRRLHKLGYNTDKSVGGYITYYGTNGRPKDYTGTEYGMLSATMEGTGKIYGTSGYSIDTQKINCEALENFILQVFSSLENGVPLSLENVTEEVNSEEWVFTLADGSTVTKKVVLA